MDELGAASVETPLVRVPYENLRTRARGRSVAVADGVIAAISRLEECSTSESREAALEGLESIADQLQGLKRKLEEADDAERIQALRTKTRVEHLASAGFSKKRLDRILVDHMLRQGYHDSAVKLAAAAGVEDLVDTTVFLDAQRVVDALQGHDCAAALAWCSANRSKLKKSKSKLEFRLRVQEFIELVRKGVVMDAIKYARKELAPWAGTNMKELQQAMATLAFRKDTECPAYSALFEPSRWSDLVATFWQDVYRINNLTGESLLAIHMQAGLSSLKTPTCYTDQCKKEDPLHHATFQSLAKELPFAKHIHSKLVCTITQELMNEHNPPMIMPNGYVYSLEAMEEMAGRAGGVVTCPRTGYQCQLGELKKLYIS